MLWVWTFYLKCFMSLGHKLVYLDVDIVYNWKFMDLEGILTHVGHDKLCFESKSWVIYLVSFMPKCYKFARGWDITSFVEWTGLDFQSCSSIDHDRNLEGNLLALSFLSSINLGQFTWYFPFQMVILFLKFSGIT